MLLHRRTKEVYFGKDSVMGCELCSHRCKLLVDSFGSSRHAFCHERISTKAPNVASWSHQQQFKTGNREGKSKVREKKIRRERRREVWRKLWPRCHAFCCAFSYILNPKEIVTIVATIPILAFQQICDRPGSHYHKS